MKVHVLLKKEELDDQRLQDKVVVVLDILFATSSIVTALAHGARDVIAAPDGPAAQAAAAALDPGNWLLAGEMNGDTLPGFAHPMPQALLAAGVAGKTLVYSTTNGTVALAKSRAAAHVYAAALLNGAAVMEHIAGAHPEATVIVVCSGSADNFNLEDFYGAGHMVAQLRRALQRRHASADFSDAALAAELLHDSSEAAESLRRARVGRMMLARGLDAEVDFAARKDVFAVVPKLAADGRLRPVSSPASPA